ncbi:golgin subfamily A member 6-like protein 22 [Bombus huntii]|uniref:golgin subfamily A member 6-like protein 22 n=1 Tax=Bombus huntii TaxID=85661 RepID=UPI0021A99395|nr:golgin subfamily A member 6-like protein 22 [Bombus huntii]
MNKDKEVWEYLRTFNIIGLTETWTEESKWERVKHRLPKEYDWKCRAARREWRKGRAKGGIITGVNKNLREIEYKEIGDDIVERKIRYKEKIYRIVVVYNRDKKRTWKETEERVEGREEEVTIIGGDWNARTGEEGGLINEELGKEKSRRSKDKKISMEGRMLLRLLNERGWTIINGRDKEGDEWTYVGEREKSSPLPLEIEIEGPELQRDEERKEEEKERREWTKESVGRYLEECKDWISRGRTVEEMWAEIKKKINEAIPKKRVRIRKWSIGEKKGETGRGRDGENQQDQNRARSIEIVDEEIREEEWKNHFMETLEGTENKEDRRTEGRREEEESKEEREDNIEKAEVIFQIRKLKEKESTGQDGLENEVWKYASKEVGEALWVMLGKIWNGNGIPEDWRKGVICPIYKRGDKGAVKSYRGVTIMDTAYKIYAGILDERLKVEIEDKLVESQFGFRKGRGVIDAVYVLNYIIDKQLSGERGKQSAYFADLKSAFDRVNRKKLGEIMRRMGVNEKLTRRIEEIYEDTKNVVRIRNNNTEEFWTVRGVRQGCPLSPTLFNIYVAGLEEEMRKGQVGGIVVGDRKVWSLSYADDIVLIADREEELKEMMKRFKTFLEEVELELSTEKTKLLGLDTTTPDYILREECKIEEIREKALKRAVRYEEKALESKKELVKECIKERERYRGKGQEGKRARKRKMRLEEAREGRTQGEAEDRQERMTANRIIEERKKRETEEREKRIRESKYNRYYRNIAKEGLPKYLEGKMKWEDRSMVARFRCGNETRAREHWKEEEERGCRLCKKGEKDLKHVVEECEITGGARNMGEVLKETGGGLAELKAIIVKRRAAEEGEERQGGSTARKQKPKKDKR